MKTTTRLIYLTLACAVLYVVYCLVYNGYGGLIVFAGIVVLFFICIGLGQAVLFGGNEPRLASVLTGAICGPMADLTYSVYFFGLSYLSLEAIVNLSVPFSATIGSMIGYLSGFVIESVFISPNGLRKLLRRSESDE